ncbi:unnamed protein product [Dicrocoelium dendriticum]|nr:unnamed protein product [Dicrocoelium dendriticum]
MVSFNYQCVSQLNRIRNLDGVVRLSSSHHLWCVLKVGAASCLKSLERRTGGKLHKSTVPTYVVHSMSSSLDTRFSRARLKDSPVVSRFVFCRPQDDLIKITVINEYACKRPPPSVSSQKRFSSNMPHAGISRSKAKTQTGTSFSK